MPEITETQIAEPVETEKPPLCARVKHSFWPRVGSSSLMGLYAELMWKDSKSGNQYDHTKFVLEIEQTSYRYRRNHNGPEEMIIPEYTPMCLIVDVLNFQKQGIELTVKEIFVDNKPEDI